MTRSRRAGGGGGGMVMIMILISLIIITTIIIITIIIIIMLMALIMVMMKVATMMKMVMTMAAATLTVDTTASAYDYFLCDAPTDVAGANPQPRWLGPHHLPALSSSSRPHPVAGAGFGLVSSPGLAMMLQPRRGPRGWLFLSIRKVSDAPECASA